MQQTLPVYDALDVSLNILFVQFLPPNHEFNRCNGAVFLHTISRIGRGFEADYKTHIVL